MRRLFADTVYWIALADPKDQWHARVVRTMHSLGQVFLTNANENLFERALDLVGRSLCRVGLSYWPLSLLSAAVAGAAGRARPQPHLTPRERRLEAPERPRQLRRPWSPQGGPPACACEYISLRRKRCCPRRYIRRMGGTHNRKSSDTAETDRIRVPET